MATVNAISKIYTGTPGVRGKAESSLFNQALVAMANRPDNNPKVQIEIASAMVEAYNIGGGYELVQAGALEALVKMANAVSTPNARSQFAKAIGTFAQTKCRVRPLIDMGGIEALVKMAKQENTPEGRLNIIDAFSKFLITSIISISLEKVGLRHWLKWPSRKIPHRDEKALRF